MTDLNSANGFAFSPKNAFRGRGWHVEDRGMLEADSQGLTFSWVVARSGGTRVLSHFTYTGFGTPVAEVLNALLARDQSRYRRRGGGWFVRLSTEVAPTREGLKRAEQRLRSFMELLEPRLQGRISG